MMKGKTMKLFLETICIAVILTGVVGCINIPLV